MKPLTTLYQLLKYDLIPLLSILHLKIKYKPTIIRLSIQFFSNNFPDSGEYLLKVDFFKCIEMEIFPDNFYLTITIYGIICHPKLSLELLKSN